jgi:hypothetical protein
MFSEEKIYRISVSQKYSILIANNDGHILDGQDRMGNLCREPKN